MIPDQLSLNQLRDMMHVRRDRWVGRIFQGVLRKIQEFEVARVRVWVIVFCWWWKGEVDQFGERILNAFFS